MEIYVRQILGSNDLCAQWRAGTLPLVVEVGRFKGIPEQNLILTCDLGLVEDEFFFCFVLSFLYRIEINFV